MFKPRDYIEMVEFLESVGIDAGVYVPAGLSNATPGELHSLFVHAVAEGYGYVPAFTGCRVDYVYADGDTWSVSIPSNDRRAAAAHVARTVRLARRRGNPVISHNIRTNESE